MVFFCIWFFFSSSDFYFFFFFFSSRRRHTRYIGDWSSDVCSSDLERPRNALHHAAAHRHFRALRRYSLIGNHHDLAGVVFHLVTARRKRPERIGDRKSVV